MTRMPEGITVRYAIPARQIFMILGGFVLLMVLLAAAALWLRSAAWVALASLVAGGGLFWWIFANLHASGEMAMDETGLKLAPRRRAWCAPGQPVQIEWPNVITIQAGTAEAPRMREYVIVRASSPRISLILIPISGEAGDFLSPMMAFFNASRAQAGKPPVEAADPMAGSGWRVTAGIGLAVFAALLIAAAANPGKLDGMMIGRILGVGGFVLVLAARVFGTKRRR